MSSESSEQNIEELLQKVSPSPLKGSAHILKQHIENATGAPLNMNDIKTMLDNPFSIIKQTLISFVTQIWINQQVENLWTQLRALQDLLRQLLDAYRQKLASRPKKLDNENSEDIIRMQQIQEQLSETDKLTKAINDEQKALDNLYAQRNSLLKPMLIAWKNLQKSQINLLAKRLSVSGFIDLNEKDKALLSNIAKSFQIQLSHPGLIPQGAAETARQKANVNLELSLMRIKTAKETGADNDDVIQLLPSQVKKWSASIKQELALHISEAAKEDAILAEKQAPQFQQLQDIDIQINIHQENIRKFQHAATAALTKAPRPAPTFAHITDETLLNEAQKLYKDVYTPGMGKSEHMRAFEFAFTQHMKKLPEEEQSKVWEKLDNITSKSLNPENHANNLQQKLISGMLSVKEDMAKPQYTTVSAKKR